MLAPLAEGAPSPESRAEGSGKMREAAGKAARALHCSGGLYRTEAVLVRARVQEEL